MDTKSPCVTCNKKFSKETLNSRDGENCGRCFKKKYKELELQLSAYKKENEELGRLNEIKKEGRYYEGQVNRDGGNRWEISGQGKMTYPNGNIYDGSWDDNKFNGQGKMIYKTGYIYEGEWKDGWRHGQGKLMPPKGKQIYGGLLSIYEGEWKDDKKHGQGKYTGLFSKWTYEGEWKDGWRHGQGKLTHTKGRTYVGEWKDGRKHGQGKYTHADGRTYEGEWKDGRKHGQGKYTYSNGDTYDGDWENGGKHGCGIQTKDGKETIGLWEYDKFKEELLEKLTCELCFFRQKDVACSNCDKVVGCGVCCQKIHHDTCPNCRDEPWIPRKILY